MLESIEVIYSIISIEFALMINWRGQNSFWPSPFTLAQTEIWINNNIKRYSELGFGRWAIILKETGELIGDCGIMLSELDGTQEYDLGYIIHYPYWHKGFGFEAAKACSNYIVGGILMNNFITITTDRLLLRKLEINDRDDFFKYRSLPEVYEYQSFMPKNVAEVDDCVYAILKDEWKV